MARVGVESAPRGLECQKVREPAILVHESRPDTYRIYDNQHLLDETEIFRKLNVHKRVRYNPGGATKHF